MIGIYKIESPSRKVYIGQSVDIERRWEQYRLNVHKNGHPILLNSFKKYGIDAHNFSVLETIDEGKLSDKELIQWLNTKELFYSLQFNSLSPNGLNLRIGQGGGYCSEEAKKKNSESHKGRKRDPFSEEWKHNIGNALRGIPRSMEVKLKISKANKGKNRGKQRTEEFKRNLSIKNKGSNNFMFGKTHSEEVKQKLRKPCAESTKQKIREARIKYNLANPNAMVGKNNPMFGTHWSDETRKKIMESRTKRKLL